MDINNIFNELSACGEVEAIALGGSRASEVFDEKSDYDVYVYLKNPLPENRRREILGKYCSVMEIGNHYWETEDNCTLTNGVDIDIIYRNLDDFAAGISAVVEVGAAANGYTTCMWHNLLHSRIVFDRGGRLAELQKRYDIPYPEALRRNIIKRNMRLLSGALPSYDMQIKKAEARGDTVSINHRTAEFLASYFDVIFALNRLTHAGEKRLIRLCKERCEILPNNFEENLGKLFSEMFCGNVSACIADIVNELKITVEKYGEMGVPTHSAAAFGESQGIHRSEK